MDDKWWVYPPARCNASPSFLRAVMQDELEEAQYVESRRRRRSMYRKKYFVIVKFRQTEGGCFRCARCSKWKSTFTGKQIVDGAFEMDHVDALCNDGEDNNPDKLQLLCGDCHNEKTIEDMRVYRARR